MAEKHESLASGSLLDNVSAWHVAHAGKLHRDEAFQIRGALRGLSDTPIAFRDKNAAIREIERLDAKADAAEQKMLHGIQDFQSVIESPHAKFFYAGVIKNAQNMHDESLFEEFVQLQKDSAPDRYYKYLYSSAKNPVLVKATETIALALADETEQKRELVIFKEPKKSLFKKNTNIPTTDFDEQVYTPTNVRDMYLLLGLVRELNYKPDIPLKKKIGRRRSETAEHYRNDVGLKVVFTFNGEQRNKPNQLNEGHVIMEAQSHWHSY